MYYRHFQKNTMRRISLLVFVAYLSSTLFAHPGYSGIRSRIAGTKSTIVIPRSEPQILNRAGGKIAFTSDRSGNQEIYVMNSDGSNQTRITNNSHRDMSPAWSPDGTRIAFTSYRDSNAEIYVMNADGSGQVNLTNRSSSDTTPDWSPDGSSIAFSSNREGDTEIYVMNSDGSNVTRLNTSAFDFGPAWSPDGNRIAFGKRNGESVYSSGEIYVVDQNGSNQVNLTNDVALDETPRWSPDGSKIAIGSSGTPWDYGVDIYVMNADGSNRTALTSSGVSYQPAWSPDGTKIAFSSHSDIYVMNSDGSNPKNLTDGTAGNDSEPDWQALASQNPIDDARFFVRQQYLDFLNREPDQGGLDYWTNEIAQCGSDLKCIHERRIGVSGAFFVENEFQVTGYVVYRLYRAAHGVNRLPSVDEDGNPTGGIVEEPRILHLQFVTDRARLSDGPGLSESIMNFANEFVQRPEFLQMYPQVMTPVEFVNKLFDMADLTGPDNASHRQAAIDALSNGTRTRAQVLLDLIEISEFKTREYNRAFVLMQYFGYLRRDPDLGGYNFWLDVLNNRVPGNYRAMICAFITSIEYQLRFGSATTRTNADCRP